MFFLSPSDSCFLSALNLYFMGRNIEKCFKIPFCHELGIIILLIISLLSTVGNFKFAANLHFSLVGIQELAADFHFLMDRNLEGSTFNWIFWRDLKSI